MAAFLRLSAAEQEEARLVGQLLDRLGQHRGKNKIREAYYDGKQRVRELGISIPPKLRSIDTVIGWPALVVDVLEERLDWLGWAAEGNIFGLEEVYRENDLEFESGQAHLDSLIYGVSFVFVGSGYADEPSPLVTVESPLRATGEWDGRKRRLAAALSVDGTEDGRPTEVTLYKPDETVAMTRRGGIWRVEDREDRPGRDQHNLGRVAVVRLVNRPRASRHWGRSEISRPVRALADSGVRTLLGMEVHREFYNAPQRWAMGVDESSFRDADGNVKTGWEAVLGRMLAMPRDEDGELPQVGQFNPSSPEPYLAQVRGLASLLAAEAGIPATYLGFETDNPPSADAIRAMEARLVKRAERRQAAFGRAWREVGRLAVMIRDAGQAPQDFGRVALDWRDPATPTRAAAADEATKLVAAGILTDDSKVTYDRIGLKPAEQRQLASDKRRARAQATVTALTAAAQAASRTEEAANGAEPGNGPVPPGPGGPRDRKSVV